MPPASAAVINSCSRKERICPRTSRARLGHPKKPKVSIKKSILTWGSIRIASSVAPRIISKGVVGIQ